MNNTRPVDANQLMRDMREAHVGNIPQAKLFDGATLSKIETVIRSAKTLEFKTVNGRLDLFSISEETE